MQFYFSLAAGIVWSLVAVLELTSLFPEPFWFSPFRTALMASVGVGGIVTATMHYLWQLWFARITAVLCAVFLIASYFFPLLPENELRLPTLVVMIAWILFAAIAGYEKPVAKV